MASKRYYYELTEIAEADIDETLSYISNDLSNPDAAAAFLNAFEDKLEEICKSPKTGHIVENQFLNNYDVRRFLVDNYIAYYIIDDDNNRIVILRVAYGKRNQNKILKDL
ncbi:type II toxin-antitoxin system RelE/ParE family toxin [Butyrivibrio sp. MC2013]|uniref:type II toxin-antitoxin system RelE/ParE family toxin n=1 Tax=Butyrivibrio sp. MC2013 TaxID=1280686 RepID=UPI00041994F8|nr:type II toxin-antitoxin system RelE/ParE family toxin [Butyrivibrio sp. MC2013]